MLTSVALERKYLLGEVVEKCYEYLNRIEMSLDNIFPYAQHGALLYSVIQRINLLYSNKYHFSIEILNDIFNQLFPLNNNQTQQDNDLWKDLENKGKDLLVKKRK